MTKSTIIKLVSWVLVLLVGITAIGAIAYFTSGFTTEFKTFYVNIDGKDIMASASGYEISPIEGMTVKVKYSMSDENATGYSVKVVPNQIAGKDFDFTLDGEVYSFQAETDLTDGFIIQYKEDSFTIRPKGNLNQVMQAVYPENEVGDVSMYVYENMFLLVIESPERDSSINVGFSIPINVSGIILDPEEIIF